MTPLIMRDPVNERLYAFLMVNGSLLLANARAKSIRFRSSVIPLDPILESQDRLLQNLKRGIEEIQSLCSRHDFARFLILFRKIPHQIALDLIRAIHKSETNLLLLFEAIYPEVVLSGTNYLLKFCQHAPTIQTNNERYKFNPTDDELTDVIELFLLCVIHRYELFYMNSIIRRDITESVSLDVLLDVYNKRIKKRWNPLRVGTTSNAIILPGSVHNLPLEKRQWQCKDREGTERAIILRNYIPVPCDFDAEIERFAYLDTEDFIKFTGVSFAKFRTVWQGLNQLLVHNLPLLWPDSWFVVTESDYLSAKLEQADDFCESALGGAFPNSIIDSCYELLDNSNMTAHPTKEDCQTVVDFLTYGRFDGDVRFVEQPFVFYPVSDRLLFWDYFRHGGLLRCLARNLTRLSSTSATQNKKGEVFERSIIRAVSSVDGVKGVRKWIYKEGGRGVWDIDIGFVYRNILFLIDAKNEQKNVRYYFDGAEVSDKVANREGFLTKLDNNLKTYSAQVGNEWRDCSPIRGAICIVCTTEAEFIASANPKLWLKQYECPRICLLTELIDFINQPDILESIETHPAYVSFSG